ncbi:MAG TPA: hypothetical protein VD837_16695 [Terriglobales bacterium]|nr:hypothetical protein [Terriglobales bacterium]
MDSLQRLRLRVVPSLALISFVSIFLELVVIRWLSAEVRIFAYFKNFPLLAAFLGLGTGCVLARNKRDYFRAVPLLLLCLTLVIVLAEPIGYTHISFLDPFELYILGEWTRSTHPVFQSLAALAGVMVILCLVIAMFVGIGQKLGQLLDEFPPLTGYSLNIAFSLCGGLVYAAVCWRRTGPGTWILIVALVLGYFLRRPVQVAMLCAAVLLPVFLVPKSVIWSPYYRIDVEPLSLVSNKGQVFPLGVNVAVNHDSIAGAYNHSEAFVGTMPPDVREQLLDYYNVPYRIFGRRFHKVLVLGAGPGNDVAAALRHGASSVDGVEIDPTIFEIGRRLHPERPYDSPNAQVYVDDARAFLRNPSHNGYDLIVFGALDSHTVFTSMSSLRLDNYVYTVECFREALARLNPDGVIAVTFYFYKDWQLERVFNAVWKANGTRPVMVRSLGALSNNFVILAGPGAAPNSLRHNSYVTSQNADGVAGSGKVEPTTDDWPFLYLRKRGLPLEYISPLLLLLTISFIVVRRATRLTARAVHLPMFFMGVGFMLIETKLIAQMGLLTGTTWVVNTLVISAVLVMILLATIATAKGWIRSMRLAFAGLFLGLLTDWVLRMNTLTLVQNSTFNVVLITLALAVPVLFAAVLYARLFQESASPSHALGWNLFGGMVGGVLEYASTALGMNSLNLLGLVAYGIVAMLVYRGYREAPRRQGISLGIAAR